MILLLIVFILPGIIALAINKFLNRTESMKFSGYLIDWGIFTFLITFANYAVLFFNDNHDNVNITLTEGSDLYRVGFVFKYMLLSLVLSIALPVLFFILRKTVIILKLLFINLQKRQRRSSFFKQHTHEDVYIVNSINFFLNLSETALQKITALRDNALLKQGKLYIYSPVYSLKFHDNKVVVVLSTEQELQDHSFAENDSLIVISQDAGDLVLADKCPECLFFANKRIAGVDEAKSAILPLFLYKNSIERDIENNALQSTLNYLFNNL